MSRSILDGLVERLPFRRNLLQLLWPETPLRETPIPPGYAIRPIEPADRDPWLELMRASEMPGWDRARFERSLDNTLEGGVYVAVRRSCGSIVGTLRATRRQTEHHENGAEVAWGAVHPAHRGKQILRSLSVRVIEHLTAAGYRRIWCQTHDHRLPSIKTYLRLDFQPFLYQWDMRWRWRKVCKKLDWPFTPEAWPRP